MDFITSHLLWMHLWSVAQFQSSALGGYSSKPTQIRQLTRGAFRIKDWLWNPHFGFSITQSYNNVRPVCKRMQMSVNRNPLLIYNFLKLLGKKSIKITISYKSYFMIFLIFFCFDWHFTHQHHAKVICWNFINIFWFQMVFIKKIGRKAFWQLITTQS